MMTISIMLIIFALICETRLQNTVTLTPFNYDISSPSLPSWIPQNTTHLKICDFYIVDPTALKTTLEHFPSLTKLDLSGNWIWDEIPMSTFDSTTGLEYLDFSSNSNSYIVLIMH